MDIVYNIAPQTPMWECVITDSSGKEFTIFADRVDYINDHMHFSVKHEGDLNMTVAIFFHPISVMLNLL